MVARAAGIRLGNCVFCSKELDMILVDHEGYHKWKAGGLIQDCLPTLTATEREVLISRICPNCQTRIFQEED